MNRRETVAAWEGNDAPDGLSPSVKYFDEIDYTTLAPPRRASIALIAAVSAVIGSVIALLVLTAVAHHTRPPRVVDAAGIIVPPLLPAVSTSPTSATAPSTTTAPVTTAAIATTGAPPTTGAPFPQYIPPGTPDFVRAALHADESVGEVAVDASGTVAYASVIDRVTATCGSVVRFTSDGARDTVAVSGFLTARGDGRWFAVTSVGQGCVPRSVIVIDEYNHTRGEIESSGTAFLWSPVRPQFATFDYVANSYALVDGPSLTRVAVTVTNVFARELDERAGPSPDGRAGWVMGRVAFLTDGTLVAHVQCLSVPCATKDTITGWFFVADGHVSGEGARVPVAQAPVMSTYCGV